jgi:mono/diheme cytochrome c family protein
MRSVPGRTCGILLLAILVLSAPGCSEDGPGLVVPVPDNTPQQQTGTGLYRTHCTGCHGLDGASLAAGVDDLRGYKQSFEQFDSVLSAGPGLMPRFPQIDQQGRRALYEHIVTFRQ